MGAQPKAALMRKRLAALNEVKGPWLPVDIKRRKRLAKNLEKWLKFYMPRTFSRPFDSNQKTAIKRIQGLMTHGGLFVVAEPRGSGKTSIIIGACLWGVLNGYIRYPVILGSDAPAANNIRTSIIKEIGNNDLIHEDYPGAAIPFREIDGNHHRCARQWIAAPDGEELLTNISITGNRIVFPEHEASPHHMCAGSVVEAFGITGGFRGRQFRKRDGTVLRPDFVFLDDPQTRESAGSAKQTADRERIIKGDVLGLAGHDKSISCVAAVTVIKKGDLAETLLDHELHPEWQGLRTRLVYQWAEDESLWDEYRRLRAEDLVNGKANTPTATRYYRKNRKKMDAGASVKSKHLKATNEISAIQHAYNLKYTVGHEAFEAEYQNQPVTEDTTIYDLNWQTVASRVNKQPRMTSRREHVAVVAFTDINYSALHWTVAGFRSDMTMDVIAYGLTPDTGVLVEANASQTVRVQRVYAGLHAWWQMLKSLKLPLRRVGIDAGFEGELVARFCEEQHSGILFPSRGFSSTKYFPQHKTVIQRFEQCHLADTTKIGSHICHNADFWRETAQRAFLAAPGAPGSCSLYGDKPEQHRPYAEQIVAETLLDKVQGDGGTMFYKWGRPVGTTNDYLDSHVGCYVAAATLGLTTQLKPVPKRRYVERRKAKRRD
jgi:hypothetical protein